MFGGVSSKLFKQGTVSCSAWENESMKTTNKETLGEQKMFMLRKFNPLWKDEAQAGWENSGTTATRRFAECLLSDQ